MNGGDHTGEDTGGGDDRILAGEYALGVLDADQARAFEARMAAEPELRILYAAWAEAFAAMTDPIADVPPPPAAWSGIEARLFAPARAPARRMRRLGWLAGAAAAALAALILLTDLFTSPPPVQGPPTLAGRIVSEAGALALAAEYDAAAGTLRLIRQGGAPAPQGRAQELWLIADADSAPISLGLLGGEQQIVVPVAESLRGALEGATLAVSDEPEGGSPTGAPTGPVLAAGQITAL